MAELRITRTIFNDKKKHNIPYQNLNQKMYFLKRFILNKNN